METGVPPLSGKGVAIIIIIIYFFCILTEILGRVLQY